MTDDMVPEILRRIQAGIGELNRKFDVLSEQVEGVSRKVDDLDRSMRIFAKVS